MMATRTMIVCILVTAGLCNLAWSASCCTNTENSGDMSGQMMLRGIEALDKMHKYWFQRRMLDALRVDEAPREAVVWRRRREQQRRSVNSEERNEEGEGDEEKTVLRRYIMRIIGVVDTHRRHGGRRLENTECAWDAATHYSFYSKMPTSSSSATHRYETELMKAELELWQDNATLPHLQLRNDEGRVAGAWSASWATVSRHHHASSPFRLIQGHLNDSLFVFDISHVLQSFWSTSSGVNATVSLVPPNHNHTTPCLQSVTPQWKRIHRHPHQHDNAPPLVLKLSLMEKTIQRSTKKRSINGIGGWGGGRRVHRQMIIQDCDRQWDAGFLRETPTAQYDDLMPCCRRKVHIDFNDLGWGSWVIAPLSFDSYYCMGRCTNFGGFATADTDGPAFYTEAMNLYRDARNSGLTPCCSPVKFSPLTITVLTGDNEEMTQTLEDVVVKQCGCM